MLSLACVGAALERRHHDDHDDHDVSLHDERRVADTVPPCIDAGDAYYLLNPDGDLAPTQAAFERWFASLRGWQARTLQCNRSAVHPPSILHSASMYVAPCTYKSRRSAALPISPMALQAFHGMGQHVLQAREHASACHDHRPALSDDVLRPGTSRCETTAIRLTITSMCTGCGGCSAAGGAAGGGAAGAPAIRVPGPRRRRAVPAAAQPAAPGRLRRGAAHGLLQRPAAAPRTLRGDRRRARLPARRCGQTCVCLVICPGHAFAKYGDVSLQAV